MTFKPDFPLEQKSITLNLESEVRSVVADILARYPNTAKLKEQFKNFETELAVVVAGQDSKGKKEGLTKLKYNDYHNEIRIDGEKAKISEGDLISALSWGIEFDLDEATFLSPRSPKANQIYKNYILAKKEREALEILNKYILDYEIENAIGTKRQHSYTETKADSNKSFFEKPRGIQAEIMVANFLKQISIDIPKLGIRILETNHYEDVEKGADIIIEVISTKEATGVKTVEAEPGIRIVQFTISKNPDTIKEKEAKALQIENQLVVAMPGLEIDKAIESWKKSGDKLGGPERYFDQATKNAILAKIQEVIKK